MPMPVLRAAGVRAAGACLLALALALAGGCAPAERRPPRQAILILLDAARPDRFSAYGYHRETTPHLDELAERGVLLESHFAQYTYTRGSVPSLLYSRYFPVPVFPRSDRVMLSHPENLFRVPDDESISLPRALSAAGLRTALISAHSWFRAGTRIEGELDELHDLSSEVEYDQRYGAPRAEQVVEYAMEWLEERLDEDYFLYLHLMDTHFPHFFEEDARYFEPDLEPTVELRLKFAAAGRRRLENRDGPLSAVERAFLDAIYDGSLRYADDQLGRLIEYLRWRGTLHRTLILVTSDHGEHLLESPGRFTHGGAWLEKVARVPGIVFFPERLAPGRVAAMTENVDLLPTTLALLGVELPVGKRPDGRDLTGALTGEPFVREHAFGHSAVRGARYKATFEQSSAEILGSATAAPEATGALYDLATDPEELTDLRQQEPERMAELLEIYRREMRPRYVRYRRATTHEQPRSPFAVAANHFEPRGEVTEELVTLTPREARSPAERRGWYHRKHRRTFSLIAARGAEPLTIAFSIPDGLYTLSAAVRGSGRIELSGLDEPVRIAARPLPEDTRLDPGVILPTEDVDCGVIEVKERTFEARLHPDLGESLFAIRYLRFAPLLGDLEAAAAEDEEVRERLRALGYVD